MPKDTCTKKVAVSQLTLRKYDTQLMSILRQQADALHKCQGLGYGSLRQGRPFSSGKHTPLPVILTNNTF